MHRLSSIALVIACLLIAGGAAFIPAVAAPSQQTAAPPIGDIIAMEQVERQYPGAQYSGRAALDFGPFDAALAALDMAEANTHEARLLTASIDEMQAMMGGGELSAERLALLYLRRIQRLDPQLNAVLELNPDALDIARQLDAERAAGRVRGPLHGIPVLLKANIGTGDRMTTSAGSA
ncbi:MAG: amidase family protein, partial [Chloroflexota bacterium]